MNVYDFDKTIYSGDSTADFYIFSLKRHKKIITLAPSLLGSVIKFYVFKKGTKTDFKQVMYRFLRYCDIDKDVNDFWEINQSKIKKYYLKQKRDDDDHSFSVQLHVKNAVFSYVFYRYRRYRLLSWP